MSIFWSITVSTEGTVKLKIELLMKMPKQGEDTFHRDMRKHWTDNRGTDMTYYGSSAL